MNGKTLKILSIGLTLAGALIGLAEGVLGDKKMEAAVAKKVAEAFAKGAGS